MILQLTIFLKYVKESENGGLSQLSGGLLFTQVSSVVCSCAAVGLSLSSNAFDMHRHHYNDGNERFPITGSFLPPKECPRRYSVVFVCAVIWYSLHLFLVSFSLSTMFSFAPSVLSWSIFGGYILLYNLIRIVSQRRCPVYFYKRLPTFLQRAISCFNFFRIPNTEHFCHKFNSAI